MFLAIILLFASTGWATGGTAIQDPKPGTVAPATVQVDKPTTQSGAATPEQTPAKPGAADAKTGNPQKRSWDVKIRTDEFGNCFVSVRAKKSPLTEISSELSKLLKIPVILGSGVKQQQVTGEFEDEPLETAMQSLVFRPVIDYMISGGGDTLHPAIKEPITIYLFGENDKAPKDADGPWVRHKQASGLFVGMVYETEKEEKAALEKKEQDLKVTYLNGLFSVRVYKQFLLDVLEEIAGEARIPFVIVTANSVQKEIDQVVTWNINAVSFEELVNTWFPNGVRLYWRTDVAAAESKPLRLTVEDREITKTGQNRP